MARHHEDRSLRLNNPILVCIVAEWIARDFSVAELTWPVALQIALFLFVRWKILRLFWNQCAGWGGRQSPPGG
jgi:hypothetical protein